MDFIMKRRGLIKAECPLPNHMTFAFFDEKYKHATST